jgi:hypothetical protein
VRASERSSYYTKIRCLKACEGVSVQVSESQRFSSPPTLEIDGSHNKVLDLELEVQQRFHFFTRADYNLTREEYVSVSDWDPRVGSGKASPSITVSLN